MTNQERTAAWERRARSTVDVVQEVARKGLVFSLILAVGCHTPRDPQKIPLSELPPLNRALVKESETIVAPDIQLDRRARTEDIVICGRRVAIGTEVVLWTEPPFYDASKTEPRFAKPDPSRPPKLRYQPGRVRKQPNPEFVGAPTGGEPDTRTIEQREESIVAEILVRRDETDPLKLRNVVDQFVLHFDVCGISRTCFRVLQDERNLSVHFLLDVDGTLYQTLDLRDTTWHATKSNTRSIGIEIAQIGAYSAHNAWRLDAWYEEDEHGTQLTFPARIQETGIRTPNFVGRTARPRRLIGRIQGETLQQYDFTPEQYAALVKLSAALCREFPQIRPEAPRDENGFVLDRVMDHDSWRSFAGILGHYHVQEEKIDPGPAFDWEPFLEAVRVQISLP
ncbi:MAG: N-acetylmuramoyl-L-alanine amidase [Planctomycetota bacterium]|nr:N-acetylmuramoyl-L-alanine amidase [Planctomycetota bacterium]